MDMNCPETTTITKPRRGTKPFPDNAKALWHPDKNGDLIPEMFSGGSRKKVWWKCQECSHSWENHICLVVNGRGCPKCSRKRKGVKGGNLTPLSHLAVESWHPTKNGDLQPTDLSAGSHRRVWWQGKCGHEWQRRVRDFDRYGCPICRSKRNGRKRRRKVGIPLSSHLIQEWHPTKNGSVSVKEVTAGSNKKRWWICSQGHEWEARVFHRVQGQGCPICYRSNPVQRSYTLSDNLCKEWHPTKNGTLKPSDVGGKSSRKVWWLGECGHEWSAAVVSRTDGSGCPYCAGFYRKSLKEAHPEIAKEWHPTRNGSLLPSDVSAGSAQRVWWRCTQGHEWESRVCDAVYHRECPRCSGSGKKVTLGVLSDVYPDIAAEWHPEKNKTLTPDRVAAKSNKQVWWLCENGHEWKTSVDSRANGTGCPLCSRGGKSLSECSLSLVSEVHPDKNGTLNPRDISSGSHRKIWWLCSCGCDWQAPVSTRVRGWGSCPRCIGSRKSVPEKEVCSFVHKNTRRDVKENFRGDFMGRLELDIYIPSLSLGIEFNGSYWHDEGRGLGIRERHNEKKIRCEKAGVRLAVIWEDDWYNHKERIKKELKTLLNKGDIPAWMSYEARREGGVCLDDTYSLRNLKPMKTLQD